MFFLASVVCAAQDYNTDETVQRLVNAGFVNVRSVETDSQVVYTIQNDAYKLQASGIAKALQIVNAEGIGKICKVIVTYYDVPQVTLTYDPSVGGWRTTYRLDESWDAVKHEKKVNSSFGKADVVIYPQLALMNLIITKVYQTLWQVNPALEMSLWPGMKFTAQVKLPVHYSEGYNATEGFIHPGMVTISQRMRLPGNVFARVTGGIMGSYRYGLHAQVFYPFPNERFSIEGEAAYVGTGYFDHFDYHFYPGMYWIGNFGVNYFWKPANTQVSLKACQFMFGDRGVKFELIRHFRGASVGFYAEKGFSEFAHGNGGFRFQIAIPPYRNARWKSYPRVTTSGQMGMIYNANNERYYYKEMKAEPSDNIMEANGFNPIYIQSEIDKLNY